MSCGTYTFSRTWARTDNSCSNLTGFTQKQLDMRRKAEILEYKQNSMKLTKKQQYAQIAKGGGPQRKKSWATQSHDPTYTNSNTRNLEEKGNTLECNVSNNNNNRNPSSASDVPGNTMLFLDKTVPLTRFKTRRVY